MSIGWGEGRRVWCSLWYSVARLCWFVWAYTSAECVCRHPDVRTDENSIKSVNFAFRSTYIEWCKYRNAEGNDLKLRIRVHLVHVHV